MVLAFQEVIKATITPDNWIFTTFTCESKITAKTYGISNSGPTLSVAPRSLASVMLAKMRS
jgi:hypothetical protein